ncbi:MAG: hypothetical protein M1816_005698 [Peltula sp. TS41687]|nr:MAG: hypothetical protein M1816_005698 [Peltula sp. TS41687]
MERDAKHSGTRRITLKPTASPRWDVKNRTLLLWDKGTSSYTGGKSEDPMGRGRVGQGSHIRNTATGSARISLESSKSAQRK